METSFTREIKTQQITQTFNDFRFNFRIRLKKLLAMNLKKWKNFKQRGNIINIEVNIVL